MDVWQVARTLLTPDEEDKLRKVIQEWKEENPEVTLVATVRLPSFSAVTAQQGSSRAEASARGLFSDVHKGVKAADMARLLGERALFAAQRLPFLARLQATIAVREVVQEMAGKLPAYGAAIADAAAARVAEHARRVVVTGALATAGVVVLAAVAYAIVRDDALVWSDEDLREVVARDDSDERPRLHDEDTPDARRDGVPCSAIERCRDVERDCLVAHDLFDRDST